MRSTSLTMLITVLYSSLSTLAFAWPPTDSTSAELHRRLVTANTCQLVSLYAPLNVTTTTCVNTTIAATPLLAAHVSLLCNTAISLQNIDVADNTCLCLAAGVLTPNSTASIGTIVSSNNSAVALLLGATNGVSQYTASSLNSYLINRETSVLSSTADPNNCNYPTNSVPNQCGGCGYACPANTYLCGNACVSTSKTCVSGTAQRRRDDSRLSPDLRCPAGMSACAIPSSSHWLSNHFEPKGQDCTAIEHSTSVSCHSGTCFVHDCSAGHIVNADASACVPVSGHANSMLGSALEIETSAENQSEASSGKNKDVLAKLQVDPRDLRAGRSRVARHVVG
ncbi:MAG: hypothetical protein TREMPRED_002149 [Tremellales sp. Tagirdzhanova-0007]|nr:MAG: hypothetical protein TREMPRED_002149 [Tremellales sp. Tagirdzhanova-0007]